MGARFTKEQAERLNIIENRVRTRPTKAEIQTRLELEKLQERAKMAAPPKKSKYNSRKVVVGGLKFDSIKESERWAALKQMEKAGSIRDLERQVNISLIVNDYKVCGLRPDFRYYDLEKDCLIVEDVKGMKWGVAYEKFRVKAKLFRAIFGFDIIEI